MSTALRTEWCGATRAAMHDHVAGLTRTYHLDHQGTVQCLTDDNGEVTDRFACDARGVLGHEPQSPLVRGGVRQSSPGPQAPPPHPHTPPMQHSAHEANRRSWNAATAVHNGRGADQAAFFRAGGSTLFPEERELLGNLAGLSVAHLQCNCGQDSLSLAQLGAVVTGVDISDSAIAFARQLSGDSGLPGGFVRADVLDWLAETPDRFDVAFASYGALCWLSDLGAYFHGVARVLNPGGRWVAVEFHPAALTFDEQWRPAYPYSSAEPWLNPDGVGDYIADCTGSLQHGPDASAPAAPFHNPHPSYEFAWGIGDVLGAALAAGLRVRHFAEYPYLNGWKAFTEMDALPGRRWAAPAGKPAVPLMYSLVVTAPLPASPPAP